MFGEHGQEVAHVGRFKGSGARKEGHDADGQHVGENDLQLAREAHAAIVHPAEGEGAEGHQHHFTHVHLPPGDGVQRAELEDPREEEPEDERKGRDVDADDGDVAQDERPAADEGRCRAEADIGIGECATCNRYVLDHVAVTDSHEAEKEGTDEEACERPYGASLRQEHVAGQHKAAPADDGAQSEGPHLHRGQGFFKFKLFGHDEPHKGLLKRMFPARRSLAAAPRGNINRRQGTA